MSKLVPVIFADDCEPCSMCGEPYCQIHNKHYADCDCIGPSNIEEYGTPVVIDNILYCKIKTDEGA